MKIKFATPEMESFEGMFGQIEFKEGVSVNDVTMVDVTLMRAITTIEVLGDDFTPEPGYDVISQISAVSCTLPTLADLQALENLAQIPEITAAPESGVLYTQAQLEEIADKDGIAGVRDIAGKMNIRGTSISKLIQTILSVQAPAPAVAFIEAPAEAVTLTITDPIVDQAE